MTTLTLMTFNINYYNKVDPNILHKYLSMICEFKQVDIILLQECCYEIDTSDIYRYYEVAKCKGEYISNGLHLSNKILVHKKYVGNIISSSCIRLNTPRFASDRCACCIELLINNKNIKIVCTHLTGGKYDDLMYYKYTNVKNIQIQQ